MATPNRDSLANGLVRIGEEAVAKSNDTLFYDYFTDDYVLHSPAGEFDREDLRAYFAALRESFTEYTISRAPPIPRDAPGRPQGARRQGARVERPLDGPD